jgi:hypothetical protein
VHGRGLAGGVVDQPEVQVRPHLGFEAYKLEVDHDAIRGLACRGPDVVGVVPDAPLVAADGEGRRPDALADADALVEAVVGDLERVRAPRLLHGARRRRPRCRRAVVLGCRWCCHGCQLTTTAAATEIRGWMAPSARGGRP